MFYDKSKGAKSRYGAIMYIDDGKNVIHGWYFTDDYLDTPHEIPRKNFNGNLGNFIEKVILG